ncbi:MAG: hydroxychlorobactene glucosyltransferase CruC [Ktedonobacteraceae bacterium]
MSGLRAKRNYQTLPEIVPIPSNSMLQEELPDISVIVPARNEEANLPRLLASLLRQDYPLYEILIVDDGSTDATAAIVRNYSKDGVRLISLKGLPDGWTGKNHACWVGAQHARYPWLLFVDADTELSSVALHSTIHFALKRSIRALSLFPHQQCETFWERLLLPFAYQQYFVGMDAHVNESNGPVLANGQYFLVHCDAYQRVGGHAANASSIVDDAALATSLKQKGVIAFACRGEKLVTVRMYTNLRQIANGLGKNVYPYIQQSPLTGIQTVVSTTLASSVAFLFVDAYREKSHPLFFIALLAYVTQVLAAIPWFKHFDIHLRYALLTPFSSLVFLAIAINSLLHTLAGHSMAWKGRSYATPKQMYAQLSPVQRAESERIVERVS